jgi:hypothetical protein
MPLQTIPVIIRWVRVSEHWRSKSCPVNVNVFQQHGASNPLFAPSSAHDGLVQILRLWGFHTVDTVDTGNTGKVCTRFIRQPYALKKRRCPGIGHTSFALKLQTTSWPITTSLSMPSSCLARLPYQSSPQRDVCRQAHLYSTTVLSLIVVSSPAQRHCSATVFVPVSSAEASTVYPLRSTHSPARLRRHPCQRQFVPHIVDSERQYKWNSKRLSMLF